MLNNLNIEVNANITRQEAREVIADELAARQQAPTKPQRDLLRKLGVRINYRWTPAEASDAIKAALGKDNAEREGGRGQRR